MFNEGDLVTPKSGNYYTGMSRGQKYKVLGVNDKGKIKLKSQYSTNFYSASGFELVEAVKPAEAAKFVIVDFPNITSVKASAATFEKARVIVEGLLKKNPFGEFAILGVVDRAKLDFAPIRWAGDVKLSEPVKLNETSVYTQPRMENYDGTTIVGTLKDRLTQRS